MNPYPVEELDADSDNGTIVDNVKLLAEHIVGHKIVSATVVEPENQWPERTFCIRLDNGTEVQLTDTSDCCAFTELEQFILNVDKIDHIITGVGTTEQYDVWHIYADFGDIMQMRVGWSCGNPFYYGYGFDIKVEKV